MSQIATKNKKKSQKRDNLEEFKKSVALMCKNKSIIVISQELGISLSAIHRCKRVYLYNK